MGLPVLGDSAPRFWGPAAAPGPGRGAAVPGSWPGRGGAPAGDVGATDRARATGTTGCAGPGAALAGTEAATPLAPAGASRRTCGAADGGIADDTTGVKEPDGRAGLPAGAEVPVVCAPVDAATTPGGGGTRPWPEDETTGDGPAGAVLPGVADPGVPKEAPPSALDGAADVGAAATAAGRAPLETWFVGSTPAGGTGMVPAAVRPLPATPVSAGAASGPPALTGAGPRGVVGIATGLGEAGRPAPGAGRSCSGVGSSG